MLKTTKADRARLRKLMLKKGVNARQVAQLLGLKHQTVLCYLCGVRALPKHRLDALKQRLAA